MTQESIINRYTKWLKFKAFIRQSFVEKGLVEVETPTLVKGPAFEAQLEAFSTQFQVGKNTVEYFLPTSPEIHLKKLIAIGMNNIFEIKKCFRNGELSELHEPEFNMLEWYRPASHLKVLEQDIIDLFEKLQSQNWIVGDCKPIKKVSYADLFQRQFNFSLTPTSTQSEVLQLAKNFGLSPSGEESLGTLCDWLFVAHIEPNLDKNTPLIVHSYPPWVSTLAKVNEEGWADRFELYFRGVEIANAFNELLDYSEHESRWIQICEQRKQKALAPLGRDEDFFKLVEMGLPETVGIALGLERLFMACQNLRSLSDFLIFAKGKKN